MPEPQEHGVEPDQAQCLAVELSHLGEHFGLLDLGWAPRRHERRLGDFKLGPLVPATARCRGPTFCRASISPP
jgi:hypothetical protein